VNAAYARYFGSTPEQMVGRNFLDLVPESDRPSIEASIRRLAEAGEAPLYEHRVIAPDGSVRWQEWQDRAIRDERGRVLELQSVGRDVTERHLAREQAERAAAELRALAATLNAVREETALRLSRAVHDEVGQMLTAIKLDAAWVRRHLGPVAPAGVRQRLDELAGHLDETLGVVRRVAAELRPPVIDLGLEAAVEWAAQEFARRSGLRCEVEVPEGPTDLDRELATALFRIVQEALTNVARHARASRVRIRLAHQDDALVLEVADDGVGMREAVAHGPALGLLGMKERAAGFGGQVSHAPGPDGGTLVRVRVPRRPAA
jgi:PAS domain S-box-containing protein